MITYLDRVCISLVGVRIKTEFRLSNEQFGWVLSAFALAYALFEIPSGMLGDRIGQRKVLIRIVIGWSLFTILTGAATGLTTLIITRFLFGMGEAGAYPNSSAVVSKWLPAAETGKGISSLVIGLNLGAAIAPMIVVPVAVAFGWRFPFFVNGIIGLIWVLVCFLWFRNDPVEMKGISIDEINLIRKNRRPVQHNQKFPFRSAFSHKGVWAMMVSFFTSQWGLYFFVAWMPVYLQQGRHFSENEMKMIMSVLFAAGILSGFAGGIICDRLVKLKGLKFGRRSMGLLSLGLTGVCFFFAATVHDNRLCAICLVAGNILFMTFPVVAFSTCVDIGGTYSGTVAGIMNCAGQIGAFLVAIVFGKMVDATYNYNAPLLLIAGLLSLGAIIWLQVNPDKKIFFNMPDQQL